ncbi:DUF5681 domain-containing protein [Hyphobacterium sp. HN65]|uniref:DUF5681 domain-containing protein n=1 Tax=Hyphobacterium lacteum TaxID=3116575 RepID=A0ABU7LQQ5_9PROT|nr:DUF5681 domain-containing protein [Hyphobacterium sp. HN65]MEE2526232.1 DUF5681 domain-containing protein [Hyphobacterium sp. HN65]
MNSAVKREGGLMENKKSDLGRKKAGRRKYGRNSDGTFGPGNPGKPKGARHKATRAAQTLLEGEAEALSRKAVELALDGDVTALRLCLERIVPPKKDDAVLFFLPPMASAADISDVAASILKAVATATITPSEGERIMRLVEFCRRALETSELEARIISLESGGQGIATS